LLEDLGELGQLLRRENLYSNQLLDWRKQLQQGGEDVLSKSSPPFPSIGTTNQLLA
jgi:transposase-like protein